MSKLTYICLNQLAYVQINLHMLKLTYISNSLTYTLKFYSKKPHFNKIKQISFINIKQQLPKSQNDKKRMKITCQHIASNCNAMPSAFDFLTDDIIVYCYKNQVGLYSLSQSCVYRNIHCKKQVNPNRANCIQAFQRNEQYYIIVGYGNGDMVVYFSEDKQEWVESESIKQKNSIHSMSLNEGFLSVTNNDALVTIYKFKKDENILKMQQLTQIQFPLNKMIETVALQIIQNFLVVFLGGVDQNIHCYSKNMQNTQQELLYQFSLTGHENSITKLTVYNQKQGLLLASASKDGYVRLWKVTSDLNEAKFHKSVKNLNLGQVYKVFLDSVLISHQCSVTNLHWASFPNKKRQLLSASLDCTICVWSQSEQDGSWSVQSRMGQLLGNKNAYYQILSNKSGSQLAALNYIGSVLIWNVQKETNNFILRQSFNGHYSQVTDIAWNYSGDFLVTVSKDQTTRVLAQNSKSKHYHQISRAQIHGYDINTVCLLKTKDETFDILACGADQKVIRIFQPPACFANYFNSFTGKDFHLFFNSTQEQQKYLLKRQNDSPLLYETYTEGGSQVLGLMTKALRVQRQKVVNYYNDEQQQVQLVEQQKVDLKQTKKINFQKPPHDDYLVKHTLWPEMNKLYGHPHELQYICKSPDSKLLASSCKGLTKQASSIIIWNTQTWKIHKILAHHTYTVYSMQFSKTGQYFVSVSKDRKLAVFDKNFELLYSYEPHSRAITSVSISSDQKYIITGSRDKSIKLHSIGEKKSVSEYQFKNVVTSVAFCQLENKQAVVCCGLINGDITLLQFDKNEQFIPIGQVPNKWAHTQKINAIRWNSNKFATCSDDHSVAIFKIQQW